MAREFSVSFEIVTPESAENGEAEDSGFELESGSLREAVETLFGTRTSGVGGVEYIEPDCSDTTQARWLTVANGMEFRTGARESRSLHFPNTMTPASRARLCALLSV